MYYDVQNTRLSLSLLKWPYFPVAHPRLTAILTATGTRLGGRWRTLKGSLRVDPSSNGPRRTRANVLWVASALARREARSWSARQPGPRLVVPGRAGPRRSCRNGPRDAEQLWAVWSRTGPGRSCLRVDKGCPDVAVGAG